jgi:hypothetical protein
MHSFTLAGSTGALTVEPVEVYGFPHQTSHFGGYDTRSRLLIRSHGFSVDSVVWLSTGEVFAFYQQLQTAHTHLAGTARFCSSEENLSFALTYQANGQVRVSGQYWESTEEANRLRFEIASDQSYLHRTLAELAAWVAHYGDHTGTRRRS